MKSGVALGTLNLFRVVERGAVNSDQDSVIEFRKLAKCLIFNQLLKRHVERWIQQLAVDMIEFFANLVIRENACDAEQRLTGMTVMRFLEAALVIQKRGTLHEECGKRRHRDIGELELAIVPGARVGQCFEDNSQFADQIVDREIQGLQL